MNEKEIKDMIEPILNWEFTYRYDCSRTCGKSYTQSLLDEKGKKIKDLQQKVEQLENIRKEAIKYINKHTNNDNCESKNILDLVDRDNLLNILNKGSDKE